MCEIQIIQKLGKEKISTADIGEFFKMMCFGSMRNNDAFGVFNHNITFKKGGSFDSSELDENDLTRSSFIIGHNRFAIKGRDIKNPNGKKKGVMDGMLSSGIPKHTWIRHSSKWDTSINWRDNMANIFLPNYGWGEVSLENEESPMEGEGEDDYGEDRNHHPFELGDFVLIHNGTVSNAQYLHDKYNFRTTINTDSYVILELIAHFFEKSSIKDRIKRIASAIQSTCEELTGPCSVVLYDKKGESTFYFKNTSTSFSLCKYGDKVLCGSTSSGSLDYLYFGMEREDIEVKDRRVYLITSNIKSPVVDVTPRKYKVSGNGALYDILTESDYYEQMAELDIFLKKRLGFIPLYCISLGGTLKIATNNGLGIREKIHKIVKEPRRRFGWYVIKASDVKASNKRKKVKLDKMKGGKNR